MTDMKVNILHATELKPGSSYIICLDGNKVSLEDAASMAKQLKAMGILNSVVIAMNGDPKKIIKVIEQE